ncbi:MAG: hypothetical protein ACK4N4_14715, partial [Burkholderiales bacterium]
SRCDPFCFCVNQQVPALPPRRVLCSPATMNVPRRAALEMKPLARAPLLRAAGVATALPVSRNEVLAMNDETAWPHPVHRHGPAFRVIARDGAMIVLRIG